jgi:hypothetical protein
MSVEVTTAGRVYRLSRINVGVQMRALRTHPRGPQSLVTLEAMRLSTQYEHPPGSGEWRVVTLHDWGQFDLEAFEPMRRAFRDMGGVLKVEQTALEDALELAPTMPGEMRAWLEARIADLKREGE